MLRTRLLNTIKCKNWLVKILFPVAFVRYNVAIDDFLSLNQNYIFKNVFSNISDDMFNTVKMLLELISIRSGQFIFSTASISMFDANISIDWLSTK